MFKIPSMLLDTFFVLLESSTYINVRDSGGGIKRHHGESWLPLTVGKPTIHNDKAARAGNSGNSY